MLNVVLTPPPVVKRNSATLGLVKNPPTKMFVFWNVNDSTELLIVGSKPPVKKPLASSPAKRTAEKEPVWGETCS